MLKRSLPNLLNALYLFVLVVSAGLFYVVSVALILSLLGAAYFLCAGFTVRGKAVEVLVIAGFIVFLLLRGALARRPEGPPGLKATREDYPRLFGVLDEVAASMGTSQVDEVFLTPAAAIGVYDRAGFLGLFGRTHRVLELGVASLHALTLPELKAILAHEYAHFTSRETVFRRFIARVLVCLQSTLAALRTGRWWRISPAYHALRVYEFFFRYFSSTFRRQREYSADRLASEVYGGNILASGLIRFATVSALYEGPAYGGLFRLLLEGRMMRNLYSAFRAYSRTLNPDDLERVRREVLRDRSGLLDFHPCPARRIARIRTIQRAPRETGESARAVFEAPDTVERELTAFLTGRFLGGMGLLAPRTGDDGPGGEETA